MGFTPSHCADSFLFTSESVGEGHPDKICDQISDAILDSCLTKDPSSKVAVEVAIRPGLVFVFGNIRTTACIEIERIVRGVIQDIGYDSPDQDLDYKTCHVVDGIEKYSPKNNFINGHGPPPYKPTETLPLPLLVDEVCAGDQGIIFGYATDETTSLLPLTIELAHKLNRAMKEARDNRVLPWLRADTKTQVTIEHSCDNGVIVPLRVDTVVISAQHTQEVTVEELRSQIQEKIIKRTIPPQYLDARTVYHIQPSGDTGVQPSGKFAGLTGRKIIVDTYGGWGAHGGGAFSGKDFRQVDRSAAYLARWIAKSLVNAKLVRRCLVQLSYAIGISKPQSVFVESYGTSNRSSAQLVKIVEMNFGMRPAAIAEELDLTSPKFYQTAKNGHFTVQELPWERPKDLTLP